MLILTYEANLAIQYAVEASKHLEVGGFGRTTISEDGLDIIVNEIYIPPQVVQGGHTDIKGPGEEGGSGMLEEAWRYFAERGESPADWRLWWHVHPKGVTRASGTDDQTLRGLAAMWESWAVGLVAEKGGARYAWAAIYQPPFNVLLQDMDFGAYKEERADIRAQVEEWFEKVEEKKYGPPASQPWQGHHPNSGGGAKGGTTSRFNANRLPGNKRLMDLSDAAFDEWLNGEGLVPTPLLVSGEE